MEKLKAVYENNGFIFKSFENIEDAKRELFESIGEDRYITVGGSWTIEELGLYDELIDNGYKTHWHWKGQELGSLKEDLYLTSSNAITKDGKLVNMDGNGNRVAAMIYGFKDVYVIVGKNKLVENQQEAIERIKNVAAPLNAKRLGINTPCVKTGKCSDCSSPERICRAEVTIHKNPSTTQIHIYYIDEELGY